MWLYASRLKKTYFEDLKNQLSLLQENQSQLTQTLLYDFQNPTSQTSGGAEVCSQGGYCSGDAENRLKLFIQRENKRISDLIAEINQNQSQIEQEISHYKESSQKAKDEFPKVDSPQAEREYLRLIKKKSQACQDTYNQEREKIMEEFYQCRKDFVEECSSL